MVIYDAAAIYIETAELIHLPSLYFKKIFHEIAFPNPRTHTCTMYKKNTRLVGNLWLFLANDFQEHYLTGFG